MSPVRAKGTKRKRKAPSSTKTSRKTKRTRSTSARRHSESDLIIQWFRLLAQRRGAWLQHLWMNEGSTDGRATVTHAELAGILSDQDSPEAEVAWTKNHQSVRSWMIEAQQIKDELDSLADSRSARLAKVFVLGAEETDLLQLCAGVEFDPQLARVCAYLQDHSGRTYMTHDLAARLLMKGRSSIWFSEMNVFRWDLIRPRDAGVGEATALFCDSQIADWLQGRSTLDEALVDSVKLLESKRAPLPEWPVDQLAKWIDKTLTGVNPPRVRIVVVAPQGGGKRDFAAAVTAELGMQLLVVDAESVEESKWAELFKHAQRQAFLETTPLAWEGQKAAQYRWPVNEVTFPLQFVLCEPGLLPGEVPHVIDRLVHLPMPEAETRERLWQELLPAASKWSTKARRQLAEQHTSWPGDIEHVAAIGPNTPEAASKIIRERSRGRFNNLAQILECPFTPDDLVVPEGVRQLLDTIIFEARERISFWKQPEPRRLFPQGRGVIAMFSGPSGTGKTMAAQVIAGRLGQDLCRVNVAQLVSKWVGETPKNVEAVIRVAAESNVVLFFDEADALFARRSTEIRDAQDKFANTDTAFLLQAIEDYPGVAVLATNLRANVDPAFLRRLRYIVEFPKPDVALQRVLWLKLITALAGKAEATVLESAVELLSRSGEATGAQIKYAVLSGVFAARAEKKRLNVRHLLLGFDRELSREGRTLAPSERERILKEADGQ
jgi:hypothetical protein